MTKLSFDTDQFVPGHSVDCVIIGYDGQQLKILVVKWKDMDLWALPGGFVHKSEDLDKAAIRVLNERAGIQLPFLEQFKTFGKKDRRKEQSVEKPMAFLDLPSEFVQWFEQRFITTGYLSLVDMGKCDPRPDPLSDEIAWMSIEALPKMIFDHKDIVHAAVRYLKLQVNYLPIGMSLLPQKFTMKELQQLYEAILDKKLDRGNFQRKMLKLGIFQRHEKQLEGGAHKAPYLYSFIEEQYVELIEKGIGFSAS